MQEMGGADPEASMTMSQKGFTRSVEKQIGEDVMVEMINKIFDEAAKDRNDFEESYMSLSGLPLNSGGKRDNTSSKESDQKPDVATTSIQVHEQSLMGLDRTALYATAAQGKTVQRQGVSGGQEGGSSQQPLIMPIIVNAADGSTTNANAATGAGVNLSDVHKLKDMIS